MKEGAGDTCFNQRFFVPASFASRKRPAMREWCIARAKERILPRVERHARDLGVRYGRARIADSRYRWGSCTAHGNVNFSWRLIEAPEFVIDYVIVHELAHLIEPNHTVRFRGIVRTHAPGMERARAWLREHGELLAELVWRCNRSIRFVCFRPCGSGIAAGTQVRGLVRDHRIGESRKRGGVAVPRTFSDLAEAPGLLAGFSSSPGVMSTMRGGPRAGAIAERAGRGERIRNV